MSLLAQDYPSFEIIVINDNSSDGTERIIKKLGAVLLKPADDAATAPRARLRYLNCPLPPAGWTGKNHALHCGVPYSGGKWLLFTDADTTHQSASLSSSLGFSGQQGLSFLTLMPRCVAKSPLEAIIQPAAMCLTGMWFPIDKVNDPESPVYFGNGQYLFINRSLYEKLGGHFSVKEEFLEDFALFKAAKNSGEKAGYAMAQELFGTRMYSSLRSMWKGWRRIFLHAFERNPAVIASKTASLFLTAILPFIFLTVLSGAAAAGVRVPALVWLSAGLAFFTMAFTCWTAYGILGAKRRYIWLLPAASGFLFLVLAAAFAMAVTGKKTKWR